jgi:hypothetical protein
LPAGIRQRAFVRIGDDHGLLQAFDDDAAELLGGAHREARALLGSEIDDETAADELPGLPSVALPLAERCAESPARRHVCSGTSAFRLED